MAPVTRGERGTVKLTIEQAMTGQHFHYDADGCTLPGAVTYGKTGKAQPRVKTWEWRRNGATKRWKREPDRFSIPVKYGMYDFGHITENDHIHLAKDCPALREMREWWDGQ